MINFYHRFLPQLAEQLYSWHEATKAKGQTITWTQKCQLALEFAKSALTSATLLHHPHSSARTNITLDAADKVVGGQHLASDRLFLSQALQCRKNYSAFVRELLAIYLAIKHFHHFVKGRDFTINTDHKPLTFTFGNSTEQSPRQT